MRTISYLCFCLILVHLVPAFGQQNTPKNILFIAVDDLKPLLGAYGHTEMHTPNFDRLAAMGAMFTNANVQQAVCGPSRASIMTGTYPDQTKVWDLHTDFRNSAPELISMPEYLIQQGYHSTGIGKIYHKGSSAPGHDGKSWSIPHQLPKDFPAEYGAPAMSFYQNAETKTQIAALTKEANAKGITRSGKVRSYVLDRIRPSTEAADVPDNAYQDGLYTQAALAQLDEFAAQDQPFFLAVGYQRPHLPFAAPQKYWDLYEREAINLAPFQQKSEGTPALAYHSFGELRAYSDIDDALRVGDVIDEDQQRELVHGYMACVSFIDAQIGMLLDKLEEKEMLEETVIVLWGDHGFHLGDHTIWCKHSNFEQATRIPLMFAGPGVVPGGVIAQPVELVDVFPTLFDMAGVTPSTQLAGKSLLPLMDDNEDTVVAKNYAISQYPRKHKDNAMGYSLRTERYRYTEWLADFRSYQPYNEKDIIGVELYDYEVDPHETRNLAADPAYAAAIMELKKMLQAHLSQQADLLK